MRGRDSISRLYTKAATAPLSMGIDATIWFRVTLLHSTAWHSISGTQVGERQHRTRSGGPPAMSRDAAVTVTRFEWS